MAASFYRAFYGGRGNMTQYDQYWTLNDQERALLQYVPDQGIYQMFGALVVPQVYGPKLSALEIASDGGVAITLGGVHALDLSRASNTGQVTIATLCNEALRLSSGSAAHVALEAATGTIAHTAGALHEFRINASPVLQIADNLVTVRGDLNLLGAINSINTTVTNLEVMDKIVTLAYPSNPAVPVVDGAANDRSGLRVEGLPSNVSTDPAELYDKTFLWHSSTAGVQQLGTSNANAESFWEMRGGSMRLAHKKTNGTVVSYGFRINQQDELEIVKYTKTSTDAVPRYHRVAKFGRA